jgi:hypothetical protein
MRGRGFPIASIRLRVAQRLGFYFRDEFLQGVCDALGAEAERAGASFVGDAALAIDHVEAVGPAGVIALGGIVEGIHDGGKVNSQFDDAELAHFTALGDIFWAGEDDVVVEIIGILPNVTGMRFTDVHHVKRDLILILFVELVESGNLPPERRSGVAAENEDHWFLAAHGGQLKSALVVGALE